MKLLETTNTEIIKYCQEQFDIQLPSELIVRQTEKLPSQIAGFNCQQSVVEHLMRNILRKI